MISSRKRQKRDSHTPKDIQVPRFRSQEQEEASPAVESLSNLRGKQPQIAPQAMADETPFIESVSFTPEFNFGLPVLADIGQHDGD